MLKLPNNTAVGASLLAVLVSLCLASPGSLRGQSITPLLCGHVVSGTIDQPTAQRWYSIAAAKDDVISLVVWETAGASLDIVADIFGPGPTIDPVFADLRGANRVELPDAGVYTIRVHDVSFFYTGDYSMEVEWLYPVASQCLTAEIACGVAVAASIASTAQHTLYGYAGKKGDVLSLAAWEVTGASLDIVADVFGPERSMEPLYARLRGSNLIELPADGRYTVVIRDDSYYYTGDYSMELEVIAPLVRQCQPAPLPCGTVIERDLTVTGQQDLFRWEVQTPGTISIAIWETAGASLDVEADLFGPSGGSPMFSDLRGPRILELPEAGIYTFRVHDDSFYYTGSYALEVEWLYPLTAQCNVESIPCGRVVERTLGFTAQQDVLRFHGTQDDVFVLTAWETAGASLDIVVDLFGPTPAEPLAISLRGENRIRLPASGTYTIRVRDDSFYYTGTYSLSYSFLGKPCPCAQQAARTPGDCTQDCALDVSDAICIFRALFLGVAEDFACGDDLFNEGHTQLLDWQGDRRVDISDGIALLRFLFGGGPAHVLGSEPVDMPGCAAN